MSSLQKNQSTIIYASMQPLCHIRRRILIAVAPNYQRVALYIAQKVVEMKVYDIFKRLAHIAAKRPIIRRTAFRYVHFKAFFQPICHFFDTFLERKSRFQSRAVDQNNTLYIA